MGGLSRRIGYEKVRKERKKLKKHLQLITRSRVKYFKGKNYDVCYRVNTKRE